MKEIIVFSIFLTIGNGSVENSKEQQVQQEQKAVFVHTITQWKKINKKTNYNGIIKQMKKR
tara:strand:+ start:611 stop:793 length:183 start_codon:yes stop_codon:yes gene_type:complete